MKLWWCAGTLLQLMQDVPAFLLPAPVSAERDHRLSSQALRQSTSVRTLARRRTRRSSTS